LVKEFKREYSKEKKEKVREQEAKEDRKTFSRELLGRYIVKMLYGWGNKKYDWKYWSTREK